MPNLYIQLNTRALFIRLSLVFFFLLKLWAWSWMPRRVRQAHGLVFFLIPTPRVYRFAFVLAGLITLILWLIVRCVVRPLALHWHLPRTDDSAGLFHLQPRETILDSTPARRCTEWGWRTGTLLRTNERLCFFPADWDTEPLSLSYAKGLGAHLVPASWVPLWLVRNWPPRLVLDAGHDEAAVFAVADPEAVLSWFPTQKLAVSP